MVSKTVVDFELFAGDIHKHGTLKPWETTCFKK